MKIIDHGIFTPYVPSLKKQQELRVEAAPTDGSREGAMFARNEAGRDFYDMEKDGVFAKGSVLASAKANNLIICAGPAYSGLVPAKGCRLYELHGNGLPARYEDVPGKMLDIAFGRLIDPPPAPRALFYKTEIYERMTDSELEQFEEAMRAAPLRTRRMWDDCQHVWVESPLFETLRHDLEEAFGKSRADAILSLEEVQA